MITCIHFRIFYIILEACLGLPSQQTHQRWYLVENESWADVHFRRCFKLAKQRWNDVDRITSIQCRWTNVVLTLSRRMFIDVVSTLTKQRWNNIERIMLIQHRWPNVVSTLIVSWKWILSQIMFIGVALELRKQHWNNFVNYCTSVH